MTYKIQPMKNRISRIALISAVIVATLLTIGEYVLPRFKSEPQNTALNFQVRTTYCDLRHLPIPPAALSTDLRQLTHATEH